MSGTKNSDIVTPNSRLQQQLPTFQQEEDCIVVSFEEYIGDILSDTIPFALKLSGGLNPGNAVFFPWLSNVADNFQQYEFESCVFTYKSMSGALASTQTLGSVLMSSQYNVYEQVPVSKSQMLNTIFAVSKVPSEDMIHPIECDRKQSTAGGLLFIRGATLPAGQDARFYDLANVNIAVGGQTAAGINLGQVWVSYKVKLCKPQLQTLAITPPTGMARWNLGAAAVKTDMWLGATEVVNEIGATLVKLAATSFRIALPTGFTGDVEVLMDWTNTVDAVALIPPAIVIQGAGNTGILTFLGGTSFTAQTPFSSGAERRFQNSSRIRVTNSLTTGFILFDTTSAVFGTGTTSGSVVVTTFRSDALV